MWVRILMALKSAGALIAKIWTSLPPAGQEAIIAAAVEGTTEFFKWVFRRDAKRADEQAQPGQEQEEPPPPPMVSPSAIVPMTEATTPFILSSEERKKLVRTIYDYLSSDSFRIEVMERVGSRLPGEVEDQFVTRAKETLVHMLSEKLC